MIGVFGHRDPHSREEKRKKDCGTRERNMMTNVARSRDKGTITRSERGVNFPLKKKNTKKLHPFDAFQIVKEFRLNLFV
jgi:hypothetical protein